MEVELSQILSAFRAFISGSRYHLLVFSNFSFGYADFETGEEAKAATELNGSEIDGRNIKIEVTQPRGSTPRGRGRGGKA